MRFAPGLPTFKPRAHGGAAARALRPAHAELTQDIDMTRFASITAAALALAASSALAQTPPVARPGNDIGTGQSLPLSNNASNIGPSDTGSAIAPRLPTPPLDENAPPSAFLGAARVALMTGRTGEAQEAMERAESRALDRSVRPSQAGQASKQSLVQQIAQARGALSRGDRVGALRLIAVALHNPEASAPSR
jgi:hypothetical protein